MSVVMLVIMIVVVVVVVVVLVVMVGTERWLTLRASWQKTQIGFAQRLVGWRDARLDRVVTHWATASV